MENPLIAGVGTGKAERVVNHVMEQAQNQWRMKSVEALMCFAMIDLINVISFNVIQKVMSDH